MPSRLASLALAAAALAQDVPGFLPPRAGLIAATADMFPPRNVSSPQACADWCTSTPGCISFNFCAPTACGIQTWSPSYNPQAAPACAYYRRSIPRNDAPAPRAIPWALAVPAPGTVSLQGGPMADAFAGNLRDYLLLRDPADMLHWFAWRATGVEPNTSQCFGWDKWIKGSATGNYLMGAGSALQWTEEPALRAGVQAVVAGIRSFQDKATGWLWAWQESDIQDNADNMPDYCASWMTRGLLDADAAGIPDALQLARESISLFNNHSLLPWILPQNGGPDPVQPFPSGFNNVTSGGYGQKAGHMIYIEYQGLIKHTLMALSSAGTQADVDIVREHYQEEWWLQALVAKDAYHAIWHRQFFSHNYEVTAFEAFLDMYVLTGNATYLTATLNAWEMLRAHWIHPGGSFAINEGSYYPPDSYYIGFTGTHVAGPGAGGHGHGAPPPAPADPPADPYYHAPCMAGPGLELPEGTPPLLSAAARQPAPTAPAGGGDPPTGELCGSTFWTLFNHRFHRLFPRNATFVDEMERSILNVGVAALGRGGSGGQGPNGTGIRYFANNHKVKQLPSMHASCCEGQGTRLFGSLPGLLFTLDAAAPALYVDLYAQAAIDVPLPAGAGCAGGSARVQVATQWPYGSAVAINVTASAPCPALRLALRIPTWAAGDPGIAVNGAPLRAPAAPGTYVDVAPLAGSALAGAMALQLRMALSSARYAGASQIAPYARYSFLYGPVLLAAQGPWDAASDALVLPQGLDPANPGALLAPSADGNALHFDVVGAPGFTFKPYYEVQDVSWGGWGGRREGEHALTAPTHARTRAHTACPAQAMELFSNYPCFH